MPEHPQNAYSPSDSCGNYRRDSSEIVVHWGMTFQLLRSCPLGVAPKALLRSTPRKGPQDVFTQPTLDRYWNVPEVVGPKTGEEKAR